ncbi:hypothetical protein [Paenibacillus lautus]|uniref:hypothetical protein n=1 Tax=Paenibacillus lautus TaxID=1401 RepID=UPI0013E3317C|nr:hypothetical protein [Paenibacillus lautus]
MQQSRSGAGSFFRSLLKPENLEFAQRWFPGFKGERFASPATIPSPPLVHLH